MNFRVRKTGGSPNAPASLLSCLSSPLFWSKQCKSKQAAEQGLTLVEVIVAILVASIAVTASMPPIILATATRIQNQQAEQALFVAQREIDQVRVTVEGRDYKNSELPPVGTSNPKNMKTVGAPTSVCYSPCTPTGAIQAREEGDFIIQTFRDEGITDPAITDPTGSPQVVIFRVGVRVYSKAAKKNLSTLETTPASLSMTNGLGDRTKKPLAVLYTDFAQSEYTRSLNTYNDFLD